MSQSDYERNYFRQFAGQFTFEAETSSDVDDIIDEMLNISETATLRRVQSARGRLESFTDDEVFMDCKDPADNSEEQQQQQDQHQQELKDKDEGEDVDDGIRMSSPPQPQQQSSMSRVGNIRTPPTKSTIPIANQTIDARRQDKPRPLKISHSIGCNDYFPPPDDQAPIPIDEVLILMHNINQSVKIGHFTSTLASQIIRLHGFLKQVGEILEHNYKDDLNRCFVSLRQACCRDSGTLGTPCRLKIMELIELRALGWRPNLSHSQYYVNRNNAPPIMAQNHSPDHDNNYGDIGPAPVSAPPFGAVNMNPFAFHQVGPTPAQDFVSAGPGSIGGMPPTTQYFLIPATATPQGGFAFVAPNPAGALMGPPRIPAPLVMSHSLGPPQLSTSPPGNLPTIWPKGTVMKPGKFQRPYKVPGKNQYKDEVIIRNADSGKIMGIKGRRVAIIEEISKTIVSFQKVAPGAKERCLTITGPTEESIEQARLLIESTIKRNASPDRENGESDGDHRISFSSHDTGGDDEEECIKISAGGKELILSGADPEMIEQARSLLQDFVKHNQVRHRLRADAEPYRDRMERRKSMPPMPGIHLAALNEIDSFGSHDGSPVLDDSGISSLQEIVRSPQKKAISTPNLAEPLCGSKLYGKHSSVSTTVENGHGHASLRRRATGPLASDLCEEEILEHDEYPADKSESGGGSVVVESTKTRVMMRVVYTREFLLQCAASPYCQMQPKESQTMSMEMPEILRRIPGKFEPNEYKNFCNKLKAMRMQ